MTAAHYWERDPRKHLHRWVLVSRRSGNSLAQVQRYVLRFGVPDAPYLYFSASMCAPFYQALGAFRTLAQAKARAEAGVAARNARKRGVLARSRK